MEKKGSNGKFAFENRKTPVSTFILVLDPEITPINLVLPLCHQLEFCQLLPDLLRDHLIGHPALLNLPLLLH